jgi:hypothetical protein
VPTAVVGDGRAAAAPLVLLVHRCKVARPPAAADGPGCAVYAGPSCASSSGTPAHNPIPSGGLSAVAALVTLPRGGRRSPAVCEVVRSEAVRPAAPASPAPRTSAQGLGVARTP